MVAVVEMANVPNSLGSFKVSARCCEKNAISHLLLPDYTLIPFTHPTIMNTFDVVVSTHCFVCLGVKNGPFCNTPGSSRGCRDGFSVTLTSV